MRRRRRRRNPSSSLGAASKASALGLAIGGGAFEANYLLAKVVLGDARTLDQLSTGRAIVGIAGGWTINLVAPLAMGRKYPQVSAAAGGFQGYALLGQMFGMPGMGMQGWFSTSRGTK
jgi:hypothetical protein